MKRRSKIQINTYTSKTYMNKTIHTFLALIVKKVRSMRNGIYFITPFITAVD